MYKTDFTTNRERRRILVDKHNTLNNLRKITESKQKYNQEHETFGNTVTKFFTIITNIW